MNLFMLFINLFILFITSNSSTIFFKFYLTLIMLSTYGILIISYLKYVSLFILFNPLFMLLYIIYLFMIY